MNLDPLLKITALRGGYESVEVLHEVSANVYPGNATALLGANGAGKTTLMKTLAGLIPSQAGQIEFLGQDITSWPSNLRVNAGLVLVPEGRMVFPSLSVRENLRLGAISPRAIGDWKSTIEYVYDLFPILATRNSQDAGLLSGGEQQMLAIGRGLMAKPCLMLLDEPTLGLAPLVVQQIFTLVQKLIVDGLTVLIAEQDVLKTLDLSNFAYVIENGRVVTQGSAVDIGADPRIRQAYLGL